MIRDVHPGSRIRILIIYPSLIPDPGGQKGTESRICNTGALLTCMVLSRAREGELAEWLGCFEQDAGRVRRQRLVVLEPLVGRLGQRIRHTFLTHKKKALKISLSQSTRYLLVGLVKFSHWNYLLMTLWNVFFFLCNQCGDSTVTYLPGSFTAQHFISTNPDQLVKK